MEEFYCQVYTGVFTGWQHRYIRLEKTSIQIFSKTKANKMDQNTLQQIRYNLFKVEDEDQTKKELYIITNDKKTKIEFKFDEISNKYEFYARLTSVQYSFQLRSRLSDHYLKMEDSVLSAQKDSDDLQSIDIIYLGLYPILITDMKAAFEEYKNLVDKKNHMKDVYLELYKKFITIFTEIESKFSKLRQLLNKVLKPLKDKRDTENEKAEKEKKMRQRRETLAGINNKVVPIKNEEKRASVHSTSQPSSISIDKSNRQSFDISIEKQKLEICSNKGFSMGGDLPMLEEMLKFGPIDDLTFSQMMDTIVPEEFIITSKVNQLDILCKEKKKKEFEVCEKDVFTIRNIKKIEEYTISNIKFGLLQKKEKKFENVEIDANNSTVNIIRNKKEIVLHIESIEELGYEAVKRKITFNIEENVFEILGKEKPLLKITSNSSIEILRQKQKVIYSIVNEAIEIVHQAKTIELTISKEEVEIKNEPKRIELNISSNELEIITKAKNIEFIINKEEIEIIHQKTINNYQIASDNNHVEYLSQEKQPIVLTIDNKEQISYKNIPKLIEIDTSNKISLEIESEHINKPIIYTIDNNESIELHSHIPITQITQVKPELIIESIQKIEIPHSIINKEYTISQLGNIEIPFTAIKKVFSINSIHPIEIINNAKNKKYLIQSNGCLSIQNRKIKKENAINKTETFDIIQEAKPIIKKQLSIHSLKSININKAKIRWENSIIQNEGLTIIDIQDGKNQKQKEKQNNKDNQKQKSSKKKQLKLSTESSFTIIQEIISHLSSNKTNNIPELVDYFSIFQQSPLIFHSLSSFGFKKLPSTQIPNQTPNPTISDDILDITYSKIKSRTRCPYELQITKDFRTYLITSFISQQFNVPIIYSEPLTTLQRHSEKFFFSFLLKSASESLSYESKFVYIAAFIISEMSINFNRYLFPITPNQNETFEYINNKDKYTYFAEQVSSFPPISAYNVESEFFSYTSDSNIEWKYNLHTNALEYEEKSKRRLTIKSNEEEILFTYTMPILQIKNLTLGIPYIDYSGKVVITCKDTSAKCILDFDLKEIGKFEGVVYNSNNTVEYKLEGDWRENCRYYKGDKWISLWEINKEEKYLKNKIGTHRNYLYRLPSFSYELNNGRQILQDVIGSNDSRFRKDLIAYENGYVKRAQELNREIKEQNNTMLVPLYFEEKSDEIGKYYAYKGGYFESRK